MSLTIAMSARDQAGTVRELGKHPLTVKALQLLLSNNVPMHLQEIALRLGVHKVSAHRAMGRLTALKLVQVHGGPDARCRYFEIPESKRQPVKQLIGAIKRANIPIGRAIVSITSAIVQEVARQLGARDFDVTAPGSSAQYDLAIRAGETTVGLEVKAVTGTFSQARFNELVGHIMTSALSRVRQPTYLLIAIVGASDNLIVEMSHRLEAGLEKGSGLNVRFLWAQVQPLELDSVTIAKTITEPMAEILNEWQIKRRSA